MAQPTLACVLDSVCNTTGPTKIFKAIGINKLIKSAEERGDEEVRQKIIENSASGSISVHQSCYCTYTSKDKIDRVKKRRSENDDSTSSPRKTRNTTQYLRGPDSSKTFNFKTSCIFCGQECVPLDKKNPKRWDRVVKCMTNERPDSPSFQQAILEIADQRNDDVARRLKYHLRNVIDLPAADAQYHKRCYDHFMYVPTHSKLSTVSEDVYDDALNAVMIHMHNDRSRLWNSIELHELYVQCGGDLGRKAMLSNLMSCLGNEGVIIRIDGCASVIGFRETVGNTLKMVKADDNDQMDDVVRQVRAEARDVEYNSANYDLSMFTKARIIESTSPTLLKLVAKLISNGKVTKKAVSLSQAIQSHVTSTRNQTTLGLAVKLHHRYGSSDLIRLLHDHGFIASYDEVRRFRKSAAKLMGDDVNVLHRFMGLDRSVGLIFGWFDNLDLQVCTPNGQRNTHAMVHEFQQSHPAGILHTGRARPGESKLVIPRLNISASKREISSGSLPLQHYNGPTKVLPPASPKNIGIPYTEIKARQKSLEIAHEKDIRWLNQIYSGEPPGMEWSGFNKKIARTSDADEKPASTYLFGPVVDAPPSHPDTVLTSMCYFQKSMMNLGMKYTHLSPDMQLFIVASQIKWNDMARFKDVILRPGVMHIIMSACGAIGKLNKGSGVEVLISASFGGLTGILNGKSWVRAMRAFRMTCEAILSDFFSTGPKTMEELQDYLERSASHPTGRHWVDNFIRPTLLVHHLLRAEREGDLVLQLAAIEDLLPYFFASGHFHYARYLTQHMLEVYHLMPAEAKAELTSGAFVCRHQAGVWNSVSSDQFGEQTAVRIGKGGLKGVTLSQEQVKEWIDSFPITAYMSDTFDHMFPEDPRKKKGEDESGMKHKEESISRRKTDAEDREAIRQELAKHSHPLNDHSDRLYNIVTGQIASPEINVEQALDIGRQMKAKFVSNLPEKFHTSISSPVKTMEMMKKGTKVGSSTVYDMETIFLRLITLGQTRHMELAPIFEFELCAVPPSLIDEFGCLRKGTKSTLVHKLSVSQSEPSPPEVVVIDAQQLLYHVVWPVGGNVSVLAASMKRRLDKYSDSKKVLVFDKYEELSPKDQERIRRGGAGSTDYNLTHQTDLPCREAIMKNKNNKRQLSALLSTFDYGHRAIVDSQNDGLYGHEEADVTVVSYVLQAASDGHKVIRVLSDDTDIFVLLVYWVYKAGITSAVQMENWQGVVLSVNATCEKLGPKSLQLLGMHFLTGSDTTSYFYGKGKPSALKTLLNGDFKGLETALGELGASHSDLIAAGEAFVCALYGLPVGTSMAEARYQLYTRKRGKPLKVMALPPTHGNLSLHILRAHHAVILSKAANEKEAPRLDLERFGWEIKDGIPVPAIAKGPAGPKELIDVISCNCKAAGKSCSTHNCSCHRERLSCSVYCKCESGVNCCNPNKSEDGGDDEDINKDAEDEEEFE